VVEINITVNISYLTNFIKIYNYIQLLGPLLGCWENMYKIGAMRLKSY
jgi:hypothetical protein